MATLDMTQRKLIFPPRFLPYLEKHRIFELFHECVELLVQVKPRDHVRFLKKVLPCAARKKDKQRIVFLAPPDFDRERFAEMMAECLGIQPINRMYLEMLTRERQFKEKIEIPEYEESLEEESCICPGEGEATIFPMYYPAPEEPVFSDREEPVVVEEEKPCICVCPCVANKGQEGQDEDLKREGEGSEKEGEGEWGEEEEYEFPCESKKKKKKWKPATPIEAEEAPSSAIDIDYGILADCEISARGWILSDFPVGGEEAENLCKLGVLPTHALRIIANEEEEAKDREYKWTAISWMKIYEFVPVTEIRIRERTLEEFSRDMCRLFSVMPHRHAPMLPRIVLIGSRGSGVTTQAQKVAKKYGMVHVEFEIVVARTLQQDDEMSKLYRQQMATRVEPEVEAIILEKALLSAACRNRGWILTGYPRNIDQMRMLDIIATPPNRLIFLEVPARECFVRLYYRKIDPCLGDEYKLPAIEPFGLDSYATPDIEPEVAKRLLSHPKNNKKQIIHDIESYFLEKKEMMSYCGKTASVVDGDKPVDAVFEMIEQIIIDPAPAQPPRDPLAINYGIDESHERLKKFRMASGMYFNNLTLNPPETVIRLP